LSWTSPLRTRVPAGAGRRSRCLANRTEAGTPSDGRQSVVLRKSVAERLLERLERPVAAIRQLPPAPDDPRPASLNAVSTSERFNIAMGCRTDEVALALLAQLVELEHENMRTCSDERVDDLMLKATAMLAELEPKTATEAMLCAQMVGAERLAMRFMERATVPGQPTEFVDREPGDEANADFQRAGKPRSNSIGAPQIRGRRTGCIRLVYTAHGDPESL
jgi:hypothetical protein